MATALTHIINSQMSGKINLSNDMIKILQGASLLPRYFFLIKRLDSIIAKVREEIRAKYIQVCQAKRQSRHQYVQLSIKYMQLQNQEYGLIKEKMGVMGQIDEIISEHGVHLLNIIQRYSQKEENCIYKSEKGNISRRLRPRSKTNSLNSTQTDSTYLQSSFSSQSDYQKHNNLDVIEQVHDC